MSFLSNEYPPYDHELETFGNNWCGPENYATWKESLVAVYKSPKDSDGQTVNVYCTPGPARFYRIEALPDKNSVGEEVRGFSMSTGSGIHQLVADISKAISEGMIGIDK